MGRGSLPATGLLLAAALAVALALAPAGCASRTETRRNEETQESSTSVQLLGNRAEALLGQGRDQASRSNFEQAIPLFEAALGSPAAKPEHQAQALLALAQAWGSPLNLKRDADKALYYYQRVIAEHPDTPQRAEAERAVGAMRTPTGD